MDKINKHLHIIQENENLQQKQIQNELTLMNLTWIEMGDQKKLLHSLEIKVIQMQHPSFGYLNLARNMLISLTDVKVRRDTLNTGTTYMQVNVVCSINT